MLVPSRSPIAELVSQAARTRCHRVLGIGAATGRCLKTNKLGPTNELPSQLPFSYLGRALLELKLTVRMQNDLMGLSKLLSNFCTEQNTTGQSRSERPQRLKHQSIQFCQ